ncbi:MAG: PAS domain S-box protein [Anaerolineales bacterium]
MNDQKKSKKQLIEEIRVLRQRVSALENRQNYLDTQNQMWETLMANTPDLVYFKDTDHRLIIASQAYADTVGANSREELIGKTAVDLWPQEADEIFADERKVLGGDPMIRKERKATTAEGDSRWYLLTKIPIYKNGEVVGFFAMDKDITQRKLTEQALKESESRFRRIFDSNMIGISYWSQEGAITDANQAYLNMIGYSHSDLMSDGLRWDDITPDEFSSRDQEAIEEIESQGFCTPYKKEYIRKDSSRVPVLIGGASLEGERHLGITFAIDISERNRAVQALEESHERFLTILNSLDAHIYAADMDTHEVLFSNQKMRDDFGCEPEGNICYESFQDLSHPCPHCTNSKLLDKDGHPANVYTWERKDPLTDKWYLNHDRAIKWIDGRFVRLQIAFDITARKEMEKKLQKNEEKLRNIVENSTNLFYIHTPDHVLTYVSPQSRHFLGCNPQEAMVHWTEFVTDHPINKQGYASTERAIQTGERQPPFELELKDKDGKNIWVKVHETPLIENGETVAIIGSLSDITKRKQAMKQKEERRLYLESILKAAPDAIVTLDADHCVVEWNPGASELFGYTTEEAVGKLVDDLIARGDVLEEAQRITAQVQEGHELPARETVRYRKDGTPVEVILAGSPIIVDGELIGAIGVYTDISDRVQMEKALRAMALRDDLTNLYNRRGFNVLAEQHLKFAQREKRRMFILYGDVDNLKDINDNFGHLQGDRALVDISNTLENSFRKSDIIARIGGDEFVVLGLETETTSPEKLINRMKDQLNQMNNRDQRGYELAISFGWSIYDPESPSSLEEILTLADKAMYKRKTKQLLT